MPGAAPAHPGIVSLQGMQRITAQQLAALVPCTAEHVGRVAELGLLNAGEDGSYPLSRPLYWYLTKRTPAAAREFLDWAKSPEGQAHVKDVGYFPA